MHKKIFILVLTFFLVGAAVCAGAGPLQEGDILPAFKLDRPDKAAQAEYLGIASTQGPFLLQQVKTPLVLVEIFSMYCPICQAEAKPMNRLFQLISQDSLRDKITVIGIGVGNSEFEVDVFRQTYQIEFPLFADGEYTLHKMFKKSRTPYFVLLEPIGEKGYKVVFEHLGPFGEPEEFFDLLRSRF